VLLTDAATILALGCIAQGTLYVEFTIAECTCWIMLTCLRRKGHLRATVQCQLPRKKNMPSLSPSLVNGRCTLLCVCVEVIA
jgi:hypothetical protein